MEIRKLEYYFYIKLNFEIIVLHFILKKKFFDLHVFSVLLEMIQ